MTISDWIAATSVTIVLSGVGIRLIMKATRLIDVVEHLQQTIGDAIKEHERRMHPRPGGHQHRRHVS